MADKEWQLKVFPIISITAFMIIMIGFLIASFWIGPLASSYFGDQDKAIRDAAPKGDDLLTDLVTLNEVPRWLEPLFVFAIAAFMFGIALEFSTIPNILKERGKTMTAAFPKMAGGKK